MTQQTQVGTKSSRFPWVTSVVALVAFAVLIGLGTWQVQRLHWKEALIATIEARVRQAPVSIADLHARIPEQGALEYMPVTVRGRFLHDREMFFFATHGGQSGWFVYTPLELAPEESHASGDVVIVNRGFVPYDKRDPATRPDSQPDGVVAATGLVREAPVEKPSFIVPENEPEKRTFFWKDWFGMVSAAGLEASTTVPYFIDVGPSQRGALPAGGVTIIDLPNNHLQYVITWYGLAGALAAVFLAWVSRWRKSEGPRP